MKERKHVCPGSILSGFVFETELGSVKAAIQLCREIRFPEQWKYLALAGAQVFFYLTYTNGAGVAVWRSHLVSRAAENQRFVVSANVASHSQQCPTMIVDPSGEVLFEVVSGETRSVRELIDLASVSDWFIDQSRSDIISIVQINEP